MLIFLVQVRAPENIINMAFFSSFMYTDLVLFENKNATFGFSKYIQVSPISGNSMPEIEKKMNKTKQELIIINGSLLNRAVLENRKVDLLVGVERSSRDDMMHFRNSGLNQVLCKLAHKNDIAIAFNFNDLLKARGIERSVLLGRMAQNVRLCRKYKNKMIIASFAGNEYELKSANDLVSFGIVIGMAPKEAKESLMNVNKILEEKRKIAEGFKLV